MCDFGSELFGECRVRLVRRARAAAYAHFTLRDECCASVPGAPRLFYNHGSACILLGYYSPTTFTWDC